MKYLIYNDVFHFIRKRKLLISLIFLLPLLPVLLSINSQISLLDILFVSTGTNFDIDNFNILQLLMLLFNSFAFLYLTIDIFVKDLDDNLENIFLRIKPKKYIMLKSVFLMFFTFLLKLFQYIFIIVVTALIKGINLDINVVLLFFMDLTYLLLIQLGFLLIYIIFIILKKNIYFLTFMIFLSLFIVPKNIWQTQKFIVIIVLLIIFLNILIKLIFSKKAKKLIENI